MPPTRWKVRSVARSRRRSSTKLRAQTGHNPRQRLITARRLMLVVVEAFLMGQTLGFTAIRAIFVRRFGFIRPCPFQKRFKQASAAAFFRAAPRGARRLGDRQRRALALGASRAV
jgi:hypothetical protein